MGSCAEGVSSLIFHGQRAETNGAFLHLGSPDVAESLPEAADTFLPLDPQLTSCFDCPRYFSHEQEGRSRIRI